MLRLLRRFIPVNSPLRKLWYYFKAFLAPLLCGYPARKLQLIGITGTDGKTSTVGMISHILEAADIPHLKISTASLFLNGKEWSNETKRTTLSAWQTQRLLKKAVHSGAKIAVLEVSSHALEQFRVYGIAFDIAGITNITEEHLDDHGGFAAYARAKQKLFTQHLKPDGIAILNADDPTVWSWNESIPQRKVWFSLKDESVSNEVLVAEKRRSDERGVSFSVEGQSITLPLVGDFQAANALLAFGVGRALDIAPHIIAHGLGNFHGTPGRLEKVETSKDFAIYIDDALTANAIEQGLRSLRPHTSGKLWAIFGCAGTRDKGKRPKIGKIVGELADRIILTDDEPYTESANQIREDVKVGLRETKAWKIPQAFREIPDRYQAIEFALKNAGEGDTIFIFGMGSYTSRNIGGEEIPWSDKDVVKDILNG